MRGFVLAAVCTVSLHAQSGVLQLRVAAVPDRLDARVTDAVSGALVGLVLGTQHGATPLPGGAALQVVPVAVAGLAFADANGVATFTLSYPVGRAAGASLLAQAVAFDTTRSLVEPGALQVSPLRVARVPLAGEEARIVVLFGQSNAEGAASLSDLPGPLRGPHPQLRVWNDAAAAWQPLAAGVNNMLVPGTPRVGPELGIVHALPATASPLWLVKCAVWQSSLGPSPGPWNEWGAQAGELYPEMLRRIDSACAGAVALGLRPRVVLVAMMQGEADALVPSLAVAYASNLHDLVVQLRGDLGARGLAPADEPHVRVGRIHPGLAEVGFVATSTVRAAQEATAASFVHCDLVETRGLELMADRVHFAFAGSMALGRSFVRGFVLP